MRATPSGPDVDTPDEGNGIPYKSHRMRFAWECPDCGAQGYSWYVYNAERHNEGCASTTWRGMKRLHVARLRLLHTPKPEVKNG